MSGFSLPPLRDLREFCGYPVCHSEHLQQWEPALSEVDGNLLYFFLVLLLSSPLTPSRHPRPTLSRLLDPPGTRFNQCAARPIVTAVLSLLVILFVELAFSIRRETQTWDEGCHIFCRLQLLDAWRFWHEPGAPAAGQITDDRALARAFFAGASTSEDFLQRRRFHYGHAICLWE